MTKQLTLTYFSVVVYLTILALVAKAYTDPHDVSALHNLYRTLNYPMELKGWRAEGGDPCDQSWEGVSCFGSSVIYLKLHGLNLSGNLGDQLYNLHNLKQLDVSFNFISGEIPVGLPPNVTHINMACNNFSKNIPHSLTLMRSLRHLNLSHNLLSGPIGNVFTGLQNLREMDLSYNNFTGDLPSSFGSLTSISGLFLQHNYFTGSVAYLANLPLTDLNIQDNFFSGIVPKHFDTIPKLWIGGNKFHAWDNSLPWDFPLQTVPTEQNITGPPTTKSNAIKNYPSPTVTGHKKRRLLGTGGIAFLVGGGTLVAISAGIISAMIRVKQSRAKKDRSSGGGISSVSPFSLPITTVIDGFSPTPEKSPQILPLSSPPKLTPRRLRPIYHIGNAKISKRRSFSQKCTFPIRTKFYTVAELQSATNSFSVDNLLGKGSLGSVYRAKFPDGKVLAVKNINLVGLSFAEEEQFLDVVWTVSGLRHPNIVTLIGYCVEHGQHLLIYEYVRNLSLSDALHTEAFKPLSWVVRLQISLCIARALDYLHSKFSPPVAHTNLKAANILLDEELVPRICDCGLGSLRPLTSNRAKIKASEIAIRDSGYIEPEISEPRIDNTKSDVYAFGVLLLEIVTGRKPFDSGRPSNNQSLVEWASSRLHDSESLADMVDPGIRGTLSSKSLSRFADIISLCIQPVREFRPPMSEIVESLASLLEKFNTANIGTAEGGTSTEALEGSFRSTNTRFVGSPAHSCLSL